jgi:hypothetical protein
LFSTPLCYVALALLVCCGIAYASIFTFLYLFFAATLMLFLAAGAPIQRMMLLYVTRCSLLPHVYWQSDRVLCMPHSSMPMILFGAAFNLLFMFFIQFDFVHPSSIPPYITGDMHYYGIWIEMPSDQVKYMWPYWFAFLANVALFFVVCRAYDRHHSWW